MFINYLHTEFSTYLLISEVLYYLHMQVRKQIILIYIRDAHYSCVWSFFSFHFYLTQNETFAFLWLPCLVNDMVRIVLSSMKKSAIILMKFQLAWINMYDLIIFFFETEERPFFCGIITQLLIPILVFLILHYLSIF